MDPQHSQYRDITVGALLTRLAETLPGNEALVYSERGLRLNFAELESEARLIARGLMACGVERGERVALWATNVPEWVTLQFALAKIGAILVTVNTALRAHEIDYLLRQSEAATVITIRGFKDVDYVGALREIGAVGDAKLPSLKRAIFIGRGEDDECPEDLTQYEKLREMAANVTEDRLDLREREVGLDDVIERRTQTVGAVLPEMEVRIVAPATRETLSPNQPGELTVRGYNVMKGYYNNPEATRAAIDGEGWLRTGDQATMDEGGYVRITGRIKDIIIRGGENISPKEIEDLMRHHPAVSDVYVYAVKSEFFGEEVAASVRLKPGEAATQEELRDFCQAKIARFKIPKYIRFVGEFPMTASGKIQKFKLRDAHEKELEAGQ